MGVLSITPSLEFSANGIGQSAGQWRVMNPVADGPRDGPRTAHYIWDLVTGHAPLFNDPEMERLNERATISTQYTREQAARNRERVKRRLHPIAQSVKKRRR